MIVQGERDIQVSTTDAKDLAEAQPKAKLVLIPAMNHVLKDVGSDDRAANIATYADPSLASRFVDGRRHRRLCEMIL